MPLDQPLTSGEQHALEKELQILSQRKSSKLNQRQLKRKSEIESLLQEHVLLIQRTLSPSPESQMPLADYYEHVENMFEYHTLAEAEQMVEDGGTTEALRSPHVRENLKVLRQAADTGISDTMLCFPKEKDIQRVAGYLPWSHIDPSLGRLKERSIDIHADLFALYTLLLRCPSAPIHP